MKQRKRVVEEQESDRIEGLVLAHVGHRRGQHERHFVVHNAQLCNICDLDQHFRERWKISHADLTH